MASILNRLHRGCRPHVTHAFARRACPSRQLHQTPVAFRKKQPQLQEDGDLFSDTGNGESLDDLFSDTAEGQVVDLAAAKSSGKLNPEERFKRFNKLYTFVVQRIGQRPSEKQPLVRNATWQHLFGLAATREQMEEVVKIFPKWRDSKPRRKFNVQNAEEFARRCEELKCPDLALQVFADHSKYGFDLCSMRASRRLLHSLHQDYPLQDTITLVALLGVYKLPAISSDLVACAMFTAACLKNSTKESLLIAREMVPHLKNLLERTDPKEMVLPKEADQRWRIEAKEKSWLATDLAHVENALSSEGDDHSWLTRWRQESGHAAEVPLP